MYKITKISIAGLFGYVNHEIELRQDFPTIITGPNGTGKTHLLKLTQAILSLDVQQLLNVKYEMISVTFDDGSSITSTQQNSEENDTIVNIFCTDDKGLESNGVTVSLTEIADKEAPPFWLKRIPGVYRWVDQRSNRILTAAELESKYNILMNMPKNKMGEDERLKDYSKRVTAVLIDTKRLDVSIDMENRFRRHSDHGYYRSESSRISEYTREIKRQIDTARRKSVRQTQSDDLSFARRALDAAHRTIREDYLANEYKKTVKIYNRLVENELAVGDDPIEFPQKTTPTVRRILSVFIEDWNNRLEPLLPINDKIESLKHVLNSKLNPSGKYVSLTRGGQLVFKTSSEKPLKVNDLSSGEQHLIALFSMLLFSTQSGSIVLIDEPEISLHAAWKHDFLDDISTIAEVNNLQIVLATHSTNIINGRWELTEELEFGNIQNGNPMNFEVSDGYDIYDPDEDLDEE